MGAAPLLVLGAGRGQLGLLRAAQARGLNTLVATLPSTTAPGIPLASSILEVDIADPDAVASAVHDLELSGVVTSCMDTGIVALGRVCDAKGLPGLSEAAASLCNDKLRMKRAFESAGVRTARFREVANDAELAAAIDELGFPVIIKATDLQGSRGIAIVRTWSDARDGLKDVLGDTSRAVVVVEEFIDGDEFGAQAFVRGGRIAFVLPHGDEVFRSHVAVPVGHYVPLDRDKELIERAVEEVKKAIFAVGLDDCAVNADLIVRDGEVFIIEVTGRAGANGLPEMVSRYFGSDYYEAIVATALGQVPEFTSSRARPAVAVRMVTRPDLAGTIDRLEVQNPPSGAEYQMFRAVGDKINGFTSSSDCLGQVVIDHDSLAQSLVQLDLAVAAVKVSVKPQ